MKLRRDLSGDELARLLRKHGYQITRQTGSHMRLTSSIMGPDHHVTIPAHRTLKIGTLSQVINSVADYLQISREELAQQLLG